MTKKHTKRAVTPQADKKHLKVAPATHARIKFKAARYSLRVGRLVTMEEYIDVLSKQDI